LDILIVTLQDVFGVGGESSATTIIWTRVEMVKNPSVMKKAQLKVREVFDMKRMVDEICMVELKYLESYTCQK